LPAVILQLLLQVVNVALPPKYTKKICTNRDSDSSCHYVSLDTVAPGQRARSNSPAVSVSADKFSDLCWPPWSLEGRSNHHLHLFAQDYIEIDSNSAKEQDKKAQSSLTSAPK